jgi:hypothetical protein
VSLLLASIGFVEDDQLDDYPVSPSTSQKPWQGMESQHV